ncbi:cytochrome P450 81E8-like [Eucalyptus grandis]|uniref:cytochrome P450 81E8-like n=1 Tax=Eucalyptus grandis TaxID=71139 RepID=UPI00192EEE01|nr:cytochrome P450 81E8-like [Eucalyptus grandis]
MFLWFGVCRVVVVSSLPLAEECFTKNDIMLTNCPQLSFGKHIAYDHTTLNALPYGAEWRNLRKIATTEVLSAHSLNILSCIRRDEVDWLMLRLVRNGFGDFHRVELKTLFMEIMFNVIMRMISGKWGFKKMIARLGKRADAFIQNLVGEHRRRKGDPEFTDSMISHLLRLQGAQPENYSDLMIKALVLVSLALLALPTLNLLL